MSTFLWIMFATLYLVALCVLGARDAAQRPHAA